MATSRRMRIEDSQAEGRPDEMSVLLRRRGIAFLLDYIATLLILAFWLVAASYIKRHWPLIQIDEAQTNPGFFGIGVRLLNGLIPADFGAASMTSLISWFGILLTAVWVFYNWVYVYAHNQQSIGKYFIGLRVCRVDGVPMTYSAAARRHILGYPLSILFFGLGLLPILSDPRGRGWHDRIAGTRVESE